MKKYSDLATQNFVDSSADIRWCPFPDCGYAICIRKNQDSDEVKSKDQGKPVVNGAEGASALVRMKMTAGENVECGQGHGFCWECMKEPHEPVCCELWEKWKDTVMTNMSGKGFVALIGDGGGVRCYLGVNQWDV